VFLSDKGSGDEAHIELDLNNAQTPISLRVKNRYAFRDLSHLKWVWLLTDSRSPDPLCCGKFDIKDCLARLNLQDALREMKEQQRILKGQGQEYFLSIRGSLKNETSWAQADHVLVAQQFRLLIKQASESPTYNPEVFSSGALGVTEDDVIEIRRMTGNRDDVLVVVEKSSGSLIWFAPDGRNVLSTNGGVVPNFSRAATDNDKGGLELALDFMFPGLGVQRIHGFFRGNEDFSYWSRWKTVGLAQEVPPVVKCKGYDVSSSADGESVDINVQCEVRSALRGDTLFLVNICYTVNSAAQLRIRSRVVPTSRLKKVGSLPRVGLKFQLSPSLADVQYYGRGPNEVGLSQLYLAVLCHPICRISSRNRIQTHLCVDFPNSKNYPDRKSGSEMAVYNTSPSRMAYTKYVVPSENGSRSDCKWIAFREEDGSSGLCVVADEGETFTCGAQLHSSDELDAATHTCDLEQREDGKHPIHCHIDHKLMGVGGDTRYVKHIVNFSSIAPLKGLTVVYLARLSAGIRSSTLNIW